MSNANTEAISNAETEKTPSQPTGFKLPMLSNFQLFSLSVGIIGIQFAWSMQIAFSSRILEPLGANPFLFGLIWAAGPITGIIIPPIIGALSDRTWTKIGRRRPFIIIGTLIAAITLFLFPLSQSLAIATLLLWIMNATANAAQAPYRALVPDSVPSEQQVMANSYINLAYGAGSIISLGVAPLLLMFHVPMSIVQQFLMTSIIFVLTIGYSCSIIQEYPKSADAENDTKQESLPAMMKKFFTYDREINKLCVIQIFIWIGMQSIYIYLMPFVVHNIYGLPDMSTPQYNQTRAIHKVIDPINNSIVVENMSFATVDKLLAIDSTYGNTDLSTKADTEKYNSLNKVLDGMISKLAAGGTYTQNEIEKINQLAQKDPEIEKLTTQTGNTASKDYANLLSLKKSVDYKLLIVGKWLSETNNISSPDKKIKNKFLNSQMGQEATLELKDSKKFGVIEKVEQQATNTAQIAFVVLNTVSLLLSVPLGYICCKTGKKPVYMISLAFATVACLFAPFIHTPLQVIIMSAFIGVSAATVLSIPYAMLGDYLPKGEEGTAMGIFNIFIAGPQFVSAVVVGWIISQFHMQMAYGMSHNWSLAFLIASACLFLAIVALKFLNEKRPEVTIETESKTEAKPTEPTVEEN